MDSEMANLETSSDYERCTMLELIPYTSTVHGALTFPKRGSRHEVKRSPVLRAARLRVFGARPFGISVPEEKRRKKKSRSRKTSRKACPVADIVGEVIVFALDLCPSRFIAVQKPPLFTKQR